MLVRDLEAREPPVRGPGEKRRRIHEPGVEYLAERASEERVPVAAQDLLPDAVDVEDVASAVGDHQAAVDAVHDDLVELLEIGHLDGRLLEPLPRAAQALGEIGADGGHGGAGDASDEDRVEEVLGGERRDVREPLRGQQPDAHRPEQRAVEEGGEPARMSRACGTAARCPRAPRWGTAA
jgi:hypothetical protein